MGWTVPSGRKERLPENWNNLRLSILRRDRWRCQLRYEGCRGAATEVDHRSRGDDHSPDNLQSACARCHAAKSSREGVAAKAARKKLSRRPTVRHPGSR